MPAPRRLNHLTPQWLAENRVQGIVFALFATGPDAWQIGSQLTRAGFGGKVLALSPALPNRRMVERELRADYPALRLRVLPILP
jgi:galactokinase